MDVKNGCSAKDAPWLIARSRPRKLIVFDWDGTLCGFAAQHRSTAREVLLGLGMREEDLGDLRRLVGPPFPQAYSMVYGLSDTDATEVTRRYRELYAQGDMTMWLALRGRTRAGTPAAGKLIAIASSKRHGLVMRQVTDNGLIEAFDAMCGKLSDLATPRRRPFCAPWTDWDARCRCRDGGGQPP